MNKSVISASDLSLTYETNDGPVHALQDIDLNIKEGEFVSFKPGSQHSSYSEKGALIIVFQRGLNIPLKEK